MTTADAREALARACARLVGDGQAWWSPNDVPRCALEAFARAVWEKYSSAATGVDVDASGVEFWARESAAGLHWDKDEELRERYGVWVTPHLATVTYVEVEDEDGAAPTVVFEGLTPRSRPDAEDAREDENACERVTVMYPREWAHFTFDGRFLHGALDAFAKKPRDDDGARGDASRSWPTCGLIISRWASNRYRRATSRKTFATSRSTTMQRDDDSQDRQERFRRGDSESVPSSGRRAPNTRSRTPNYRWTR